MPFPFINLSACFFLPLPLSSLDKCKWGESRRAWLAPHPGQAQRDWMLPHLCGYRRWCLWMGAKWVKATIQKGNRAEVMFCSGNPITARHRWVHLFFSLYSLQKGITAALLQKLIALKTKAPSSGKSSWCIKSFFFFCMMIINNHGDNSNGQVRSWSHRFY